MLGFVECLAHDRDDLGVEFDGDTRSLDAGRAPGTLAAGRELIDEDARNVG